jgi:DNA polymerase-1
VGLENVKLHLVDDFDTAWECMNWLEGMDEIAVDTETTGLVIGKDTVRLVQVGGIDDGWAIPWHRWSGLFEDIIKKFDGRLTMQNAKFDAGMLEHMGVHIPRERIDDVRPMSHILEPNYSTALKPQAARHIDPQAASAQKELDDAIKRWGWDGVPVDFGPYWQYGALDPVLTARLKAHHYPLVMADAPKAYDLENSVTWVTEKMERHGARIDVPYAQLHYDKFMRYCEDAEAWVKKEYGVSPGSNQAIVRILENAGYRFTKATAAGAVSLDKEVLSGVDHPLAEVVLKRRQLQKLASTYLTHFLGERDSDDFIHPSINTLGARTSRMSMERPNLQNLPRKSEKNKAAEVIRNCVIPSDGNILLMCDFDQIEMRLLAHLSQDPGLIAAFGLAEDFFVTLAREVFLDPTITKEDPRRSRVKNVGYAEIYGAGIAKMAQTAGVPEDQIRVVKNRWDASYPGVKRFKQAIENQAWGTQRTEGVPYARSIVTNRKHVADVNKIYALVNYLIQGTAAEVFKLALLKLDAAGLGKFMVVPVHDEIILDVPLNEVDDVVDALRDNMNDNSSFLVPISASVSSGERWGTKTEW